MSRGKNPIWQYFQKLSNNQSKAECTECNKILSLGSDKPRHQTVSGLKSHLSTCHKDIYTIYLKRVAEDDGEQVNKKMKAESGASGSKPVTTWTQPTLQNLSERRVEWPDDHEITHRIDKCLMDLIIVDMLPYTVVNGPAFKRLNFGDPLGTRRYRLKSEKYFRTTLMPATYDRVSQKVKQQLSTAAWISFTTDVWTNPSKTCSLLSFTGHFLEGPVRRKVVLSAMPLEDDHTGVYLASKLKEAISKWEIESKVHVGVRDNAANMICAMRHADVCDVSCAAHTLQLVLHDAVFTQTSVEAVVKKCRRVVAHFKHSEQACRHLREYQASRDVPEHKLVQDVDTRWNSTFLMLERLAEQQKAINLYGVERGGIDTLTNAEWELVERVVKILKPFYAATVELSSDDACVSVIIPLLAMLHGKLESTSADRGLLQMKAALRDSVTRRFAQLKSSITVVAATVLDPRFKDAYCNAQEKSAAVDAIKRFLHSTGESSTPSTSTADADTSLHSAGLLIQTPPAAETDLWAEHDALRIQPASDVATPVPLYEQQLSAYLTEPRVPRQTNIYSYWNHSQFPALEPAARKYLSAPPTSVASEQLFSSAGQLYADRRSNLLGENAEKLLFMAYNIRLLDFNY